LHGLELFLVVLIPVRACFGFFPIERHAAAFKLNRMHLPEVHVMAHVKETGTSGYTRSVFEYF
jgi:hypothetical protein